MKYISTRNNKLEFEFQDVFIKGLADDGGLYVPKSKVITANISNNHKKYAITWFSMAISILLLYLYFRKKNY